MKTLLLGLFSLITFGLVSAPAQEDGALPFPVSLGGQAATHAKGSPFAKVDKAVASDAAIEVGAKGEAMIIINVAKTDEKGEPVPGVSPAVILLQGTTKGTLAGTMNKSKLTAGNYLLSVVAGSKTATIQIKIQ